MELLDRLLRAGLTVTADADKIIVAPRAALTDELRAEIRLNKPALLAALIRPCRLTEREADAAHAQPWDDATIARFVARVSLFLRRGVDATDADDLAERLVLRDREQDARHSCAECHHGRGARCPDGAPLPDGTLHRCPVFEPCILAITL